MVTEWLSAATVPDRAWRMSWKQETGSATDFGKLACHGFWKAGGGKGWRGSELGGSVAGRVSAAGNGMGLVDLLQDHSGTNGDG